MADWWAHLIVFDKILWFIALTTSIVFAVQMVMTFLGLDSDGVAADFSGDINSDVDLSGASDTDQGGAGPFQIFTLRNFINFFLAFSWTGIALRPVIESIPLIILLSALSGIALSVIVMLMFYSLSRATESGNINIKNALNKSAHVYLTIPARKSGIGKVQMHVQGNLRDFEAVTEGDSIPTGQSVRVVSISDNNILIVAKS